MAGEATIQLTGFVHKQPELKFLPNGTAVCKMTVKVTPFNAKTREKKDPSWYSVSVWREGGESAADAIREGDRVTVVGTLEINSYEKDGQKRYVPEVTAQSIGIVPRKKESASGPNMDDGSPW